ncbi:MAG: 50S ribosomal protein L20 [Actinomycetia bacterium]|nr:50S ribosomal protein L20 [Actinomycetes bacterium]
MPRVKRGIQTRKKHKKILKMAKGYYGAKSRTFRAANEQVLHSLAYSYRDRRARKREFRKLWIIRISAAAKLNGISYSRFMNGLKLANVNINRKMLSDLAIKEPEGFSKLVEVAREKLEVKSSA